jgi:hypothetical protein
MLIHNIFKSKTAQVQNEAKKIKYPHRDLQRNRHICYESHDITFSQTKIISP